MIIRRSARRFRRASAVALVLLNTSGETKTPTPSNYSWQSGSCSPFGRAVNPQRTELVKRQLRELLDEIGTAQCDLDALLLATKTEALAELIARVESRISGILWSLRSDAAPEVETAPPAEVIAEPASEPGRTHLAVVPPPDQPELPIPSPNASIPPAIALVRSETELAEVAFVEIPPQEASTHPDQPTPVGEKPLDTSSPSGGPLSSIMSLSEDERFYLNAIHAAIRRANISTSTLPPDRIPTTILPFTSIFPASSAARPITPPGSTTSLSSWNA